jgi:hypothetical protein
VSCREEYGRLQAIHECLINEIPQMQKPFENWKIKLGNLESRLSEDSQELEAELNTLTQQFRYLWMMNAASHSFRTFKSPAHYQPVYSQKSEKHHFPYDRWGKTKLYEKRYGEGQKIPAGWSAKHRFFANAMASLSTFLLQYRASVRKQALSVLGQVGYFEFQSLFQMICGKDISVRLTKTQDAMLKHLKAGAGDIVLFEPVYATDQLDVFDLDAFLDAWKERPTRNKTTLLVDTTLTGHRFGLADFMERLSDDPPAMIVQFASAIKLYQVGMEFSNFSILSSYVHESSPFFDSFYDLDKSIRVARQLLGTGVTYDEYSVMEFLLSGENTLFEDHCDAVFDNNRQLAEEIQGQDGLIEKVVHPSLGNHAGLPWAVSSYVILLLKEGTMNDLKFLKRVLQKTAEKRGLLFQSGSSFGFRHHRFEVNDYHEADQASIRIAMGAFDGPSVKGIYKLINEVMKTGSFKAMREAYPQIQHPDDV